MKCMDDHNLANSLYRVIRPAATTMLEQIQRHLLSPWAGIRRIHQQQTMIPPGLDLMKIDNEVDRLTNTCATPRAILDTPKIDKQIEDMANHKSFQNRIDILKHHLPTPTIWGKPFFLRELGIIAIPHIMEEFADSELVTVVREIVCSLRDDKEIGDKLEKIVEDNLSDMLREKLGIKVSKISRNQHFHLDNENGEIDLVVECEGVLIFLVEVKKTIDD